MLIFYCFYFGECVIEVNMKTRCCAMLSIGLTYCGHLILSLLEIYPLLNFRIAYAFFRLTLATDTHLGLLSHNPIIVVLEVFFLLVSMSLLQSSRS